MLPAIQYRLKKTLLVQAECCPFLIAPRFADLPGDCTLFLKKLV